MANEKRKLRGLVMPGDTVIPSGKLKKQLLFFDEVILSDPSDRALIAHRELRHRSRDGSHEFWEAERSPFPREVDYEERFSELLQGTEQLQRVGKLRVLSPGDWRVVDPWLRMNLHVTAIADPELVLAAIPDFSERKPFTPQGVIYAAGVFHLKGQPPPQLAQLRTDPPYRISDIDQSWNTLAYLRLGRAMKYVRVAQTKDAAPIAWDDSTSEILVTLGRSAFRELPSPETLAGAAIPLDVFEPQELEAALMEMPWNEVIKIRKEILPHVAQYRSKVIQTARRVYRAQLLEFDQYRDIVQADHQSLISAQEELRKAWQGLKIMAACRGLGAAGSVSLIIPSDWTDLFGRILTGFTVGVGVLASDIRTFLQSRGNVRRHPLFVIDRLLSNVR
ncbi:MAG: hypothetical protein ACLQT6_06995 [Desulfomonilaceae bacterium]